MIDRNRVVIFDQDEFRRARICRTLIDRGFFAEPLYDLSELRLSFQSTPIALLHNDVDQLEQSVSQLTVQRSWVPALVYDTSPTPEKIVRAIKAGAIDYLEWPFSAEKLRERIAALEDELQHLAIIRERENQAYQRWLLLSDREQQVLKAISSGGTTEEIANLLSISPRTVEIHRTNAIKKIGARRTVDAVRIMVELGSSFDLKKIA